MMLFGLAFLGGMLMPQFEGGNIKTSILEYGLPGSKLEDDIIRFHLQVNETTNDYLDKLTSTDEPNVDYPTSEEGCSEDNVSTFCLASVLNEELTAFEIGMLFHKDNFRDATDDFEAITIGDAMKQQELRGSLIDSEIEAARKAVNLTLAVYNQAQLTYPVHEEFIKMVNNLEEYRDNLADIRTVIEQYPYKFNNATTTQCK